MKNRLEDYRNGYYPWIVSGVFRFIDNTSNHSVVSECNRMKNVTIDSPRSSGIILD